MESFDILNLRNKQRLFFIEMKAFVIGLQDLSDEKSFLEKKEELGIWIDKIYQEEVIDENEKSKIRNAYDKMSQTAVEVYQLVNQAKRNEAKEALKLFEKRTKIMLTLLDNLSAKYKNKQ